MKSNVFIYLVMLFSGTSAFAGFSVTEVTGTSDVLTDGALVQAVNFGGSDSTVNGLTFTGGSDASVFSQIGGDGVAIGTANGYSTGGGGLADFVELLNKAAWQKKSGTPGDTFTLHLTGLIANEDYRFQLLAGETRSNQNHPMTVTVEGNTSDIYTYGTLTDAIAKTIRVDAYFTASTTDVDITLTVPTYSSTISGGLMFHAYALHAMSDIGGGQALPSSLSLFEPSQHSESFSVLLTGPVPTEGVFVTVDPGGISATAADIQLSAEGVIADPGHPIVLTFTPEDYDVAQIVTVEAVLDGETENDEQARIECQLSGDSAYAGGYIPPVNVTISDTCKTVIAGDFDGNCIVDITDFAQLASVWFDCTVPFGAGCVDRQ